MLSRNGKNKQQLPVDAREEIPVSLKHRLIDGKYECAWFRQDGERVSPLFDIRIHAMFWIKSGMPMKTVEEWQKMDIPLLEGSETIPAEFSPVRAKIE
jgi:hypothetical protein